MIGPRGMRDSGCHAGEVPSTELLSCRGPGPFLDKFPRRDDHVTYSPNRPGSDSPIPSAIKTWIRGVKCEQDLRYLTNGLTAERSRWLIYLSLLQLLDC